MGNLFTRLSSFLFILIGRQPNSEKERSGFELARLAAQRIPNGHGLLFRLIANKHLHRPQCRLPYNLVA